MGLSLILINGLAFLDFLTNGSHSQDMLTKERLNIIFSENRGHIVVPPGLHVEHMIDLYTYILHYD